MYSYFESAADFTRRVEHFVYYEKHIKPRRKKAFAERMAEIRKAIKVSNGGGIKAKQLLMKLDVDLEKFVVTKYPKPEIGSEIYIPTRMYIDHGEDDIQGGRATITEISLDYTGGEPTWFVSVKEVPNGFNYTCLMEDQAELKKEFKRGRARKDPDYG